MGIDFVRNGNVLQTDRDHLGARGFAAFADGIGDFASFAETDANAATLVANNNERAEIKSPSTFDHFGRAVDKNDLFSQFLFLAI